MKTEQPSVVPVLLRAMPVNRYAVLCLARNATQTTRNRRPPIHFSLTSFASRTQRGVILALKIAGMPDPAECFGGFP